MIVACCFKCDTDGTLKTTQQIDQALKLIKNVEDADPTKAFLIGHFEKHLMALFRYINRYQYRGRRCNIALDHSQSSLQCGFAKPL